MCRLINDERADQVNVHQRIDGQLDRSEVMF